MSPFPKRLCLRAHPMRFLLVSPDWISCHRITYVTMLPAVPSGIVHASDMRVTCVTLLSTIETTHICPALQAFSSLPLS